jgi:hypothetical protein
MYILNLLTAEGTLYHKSSSTPPLRPNVADTILIEYVKYSVLEVQIEYSDTVEITVFLEERTR